ncbi:MAG TPA: DUF2786 domain-containing protein [Acidimicrobiales bacterium]|nr:DUF2786 domain-containing protein [Acidimicrobiales bacterium]
MGKRQRKHERPGDGQGERARTARPPRSGRARGLRSHQVDAAIDAAVASCGLAVGPPARHLVEPLASGVATGPGAPGADGAHPAVDRALARALIDAVTRAWTLGWQPADVHRAVARLHGRPHARLVADAIGCEARRRPDLELPARWRRQLDAIGATDTEADESRPGAWVVAPGVARFEGVAVAVETLAALRRLPRLPHLGPAPGDPAHRLRRAGRDERGADPRVLHKVAALLAKAESTTFPDEAEALTGKAQELMTRHAIDRAELDARRGGGSQVGGRRVGIDDPYAGPRYLLLSAVAEANRCRAVWSKVWGFATVFGDEGDLDAVELLYTSLLVQATRAMVAEGGGAGRTAASAGRTRSFRQSFLVAFAGRIGARLREVADVVTAEAASRRAGLLPVLARRSEAAEAAVNEAYPSVGRARVSANDAAGWHAGAAAADRAQLDLHEALRGHAPDPPAVP